MMWLGPRREEPLSSGRGVGRSALLWLRGRLFVVRLTGYALLVIGGGAGCGANAPEVRRGEVVEATAVESALAVACLTTEAARAAERARLTKAGRGLPLTVRSEDALAAMGEALSNLISAVDRGDCADGEPLLVHGADPHGVADGALDLRASAPGRRLLVHAPHVHFDVGTMRIAEEVAAQPGSRGLLFNTAHRFAAAGCDYAETRPRACPSDVVHGQRGFFDVADAVLSQRFPQDVTLAVHGFKKQAGDPDVIVSAAGTVAVLEGLAAALSAALPNHVVARYPDEVQRLGGTSGHQAQRRKHSGQAFFHLELSRALRRHLSGDAAARTRFALAVMAATMGGSAPSGGEGL